MGGKRKSAGPTAAGPAQGELISLRLPADLLDGIDAQRGTMSRSAWLRDIAERAVLADDLRAVREVLEYARARGVTLEMLELAARALREP